MNGHLGWYKNAALKINGRNLFLPEGKSTTPPQAAGYLSSFRRKPESRAMVDWIPDQCPG